MLRKVMELLCHLVEMATRSRVLNAAMFAVAAAGHWGLCDPVVGRQVTVALTLIIALRP